jgi:hypothetical protein
MLQHLTFPRRAITLVELITVLLIMLLLMSISVPLILYFGRTNRDQGEVDGLARYLGSNQFQAILLRQPRGIKLSRNAGPDSPLPPNSSWFNRVEFVELYHDFAMRDASLALGLVETKSFDDFAYRPGAGYFAWGGRCFPLWFELIRVARFITRPW